MNLRLLLTTLLFVPFVTKAQVVDESQTVKDVDVETKAGSTFATPDSKPVVFTNTGFIYFGESKNAKPGNDTDIDVQNSKLVMNIQGSALFKEAKKADGTLIVDGELKMLDNSGISLTGDWIVDMKDATTLVGAKHRVSGFNVSTSHRFGFVKFNNAVRADVSLYNATQITTPGSYPGVAEPIARDKAYMSYGENGTAKEKQELRTKQYIKSYYKDADRYDKDVEKPKVVFPNVLVDSFSYVALNHLTNLELGPYITNSYPGSANPEPRTGNVNVNGGGLFSVEAHYSEQAGALDDENMTNAGPVSPGMSEISTKARLMHIPNFYFYKINRNKNIGGNYVGQVMYDLKMFDKTNSAIGGIGSNLVVDKTSATDHEQVILMPFSSPYVGMASDYMLYNALTKPTREYIGGQTGPIVDHKGDLEQGVAYFIAQNVGHFDYNEISAKTLSHPKDRSYGGYHFNRNYFLKEKKNFSQRDDASLEVFQSPREAVKIELGDGLNFVANPYLQTIDIRDLVLNDQERDLVEWTFDQPGPITPKVGPTTSSDIRNKYWVPHTSSVQWIEHEGANYFRYRVQYFDRQSQGGTSDNKFIGPLQVFVLQVREAIPIQLPYEQFQRNLNVAVPRSGKVEEDKKDIEDERVDEILLQTEIFETNQRTRDGKDGGAKMLDRVSIVLREGASLAHNDRYDSPKLMINRNVDQQSEDKLRVKAYSDEEIKPFGGILYAKSSRDNVNLMTSVIPTTVKQIPIYFAPTEVESKVKLTVGRMETLRSVSRVWLKDKFEDNKIVELTPETEYEFTSRPLSAELSEENRFVLYFNEEPEEVESGENSGLGNEKPIIVYYETSSLYLKHLAERDLNSNVQIFDLQGRMVGNTKVTEVPFMTYSKPLSLGTYIVKITGKRNYTTKFIVLPN